MEARLGAQMLFGTVGGKDDRMTTRAIGAPGTPVETTGAPAGAASADRLERPLAGTGRAVSRGLRLLCACVFSLVGVLVAGALPASAATAGPQRASTHECFPFYESATICVDINVFYNNVTTPSGIVSDNFHHTFHVVLTTADGQVSQTVDGKGTGHALYNADGSLQELSDRLVVSGKSTGGTWCEVIHFHFANGTFQVNTNEACRP